MVGGVGEVVACWVWGRGGLWGGGEEGRGRGEEVGVNVCDGAEGAWPGGDFGGEEEGGGGDILDVVSGLVGLEDVRGCLR